MLSAPTKLSAPGEPLGLVQAVAERAIRRAGVSVLELETSAETERAAELLREVWRGPELPVPANLLRTVQHTGGYVFGAYDEAGSLLAASMGLLAREGLHSHITGVMPTGQRRGLGYALKQHQRLWALEHGLTCITWTCDPLVRRNITFNLHALGATVALYLPDHYGAMNDGVNKGDESDRFEVHWDLLGPAAAAAGQARLPFLHPSDLPIAVAAGPDGRPTVSHVSGPARLVALPPDIEGLRRSNPSAALAWRRAVRDAVLPALNHGARIHGLTESGALVLDTA